MERLGDIITSGSRGHFPLRLALARATEVSLRACASLWGRPARLHACSTNFSPDSHDSGNSHRSVTSHKCAAPAPPTEGQQRIVDAEERKRRAREIISRNFPGRSGGSGAKK